MPTHLYLFEGFEVRIDDEALWGLIMSRSLGRDLRASRKGVEGLILDLLLQGQSRHGSEIAKGTGDLTFTLRAGEDLRNHCAQCVEGLEVQTYLMTRNQRLAPWIQDLLPDQAGTLEAGSEPPHSKVFPRGGILLVDAMSNGADRSLQPVLGLDGVVQRHLVDPESFRNLSPEEQERAIPILAPATRATRSGQPAARKGFGAAINAALFSQVFRQARARSLRWRVHLETDLSPEGNRVDGLLHFDGTDRLFRAQDLRLDVGWGEVPAVRFKDVLGQDELKARFKENLAWLSDPRGAPGLKAAVLWGPPGTGKSMLCQAISGEAGCPCIIVAASQFQSMWSGESERMVRQTFAALQDQDAAVMVIDELDALAWRRDQTHPWMAQDQSSIMGSLLAAVDGLRKGPGRVLVLCTTNQLDRVEPALLRSGRLGETIQVGLPGIEERRAILGGLMDKDLGDHALSELVSLTTGLSPADLLQLVETARKRAAPSSRLSMEILRQVVFESRAGERKRGLQLSDANKRRVAFHESGHALLAHDLLGPDKVAHLSLMPQAKGSLGAAYLARSEDGEMFDRRVVMGHLAMFLGGKAAETLLAPDSGASGGVEQDLAEATTLAQRAVTAWGMDDTLPPLSFGDLAAPIQHHLGHRVAERIQAWILEAEACARGHLEQNRDRLERLAERLLQAETLHLPDILAILDASKKIT